MKYISSLMILLIVGCSTIDYKIVFVADSMKKFTCEPMVWDSNLIESIREQSLTNDFSEFEKMTGYSNCSVDIGDDSFHSICKNPIEYKHILTTKKAMCDKFMIDNNLL